MKCDSHTVNSRYNKLLGPSEITLLYPKKNYIWVAKANFELWDQENYLCSTIRS